MPRGTISADCGSSGAKGAGGRLGLAMTSLTTGQVFSFAISFVTNYLGGIVDLCFNLRLFSRNRMSHDLLGYEIYSMDWASKR
jgi:hypothetical protein